MMFRSMGIHSQIVSCALAFCAATDPSANAAERCEDIFSSLGSRIEGQNLFETDFGMGAFITKVSATEFRIEPPLFVANSARASQVKLAELARKNKGVQFTVLFNNVSMAEALTFKMMLQRESRLEDDDRLTAVLLPESKEGVADAGYGASRERSLAARDLMLRRYDWTAATVTKAADSLTTNTESYRMTVSGKEGAEQFLLRLQLRGKAFFKNRAAAITGTLVRNNFRKANPEQVAHAVVNEMMKSDEGVTGGSLKVMAGDFEIARADFTHRR